MNSFGYIRGWAPEIDSGMIYGCSPDVAGLNVPFTYYGLDPSLRADLISRGPIDLEILDWNNPAANIIRVRFQLGANSLAYNIVFFHPDV